MLSIDLWELKMLAMGSYTSRLAIHLQEVTMFLCVQPLGHGRVGRSKVRLKENRINVFHGWGSFWDPFQITVQAMCRLLSST